MFFLYLSSCLHLHQRKACVSTAAKKLKDVRRQFHAIIVRSGSISCVFQQARWHTRTTSWQLVGKVPCGSFVHCQITGTSDSVEYATKILEDQRLRFRQKCPTITLPPIVLLDYRNIPVKELWTLLERQQEVFSLSNLTSFFFKYV